MSEIERQALKFIVLMAACVLLSVPLFLGKGWRKYAGLFCIGLSVFVGLLWAFTLVEALMERI